MTNKNLQSTLQELGEIMGIDSVTLDEDGVARLLFDGSMVLDLQKLNESSLGMMISVQELSEDSDAEFFRALLSAPLSSGCLLPGVFPAWDRTSGELLLMRVLPISNLTARGLASAIEGLLECADKWREGSTLKTNDKSESDMTHALSI